MNSKSPLVKVSIPLGDLVNIFNNQSSNSDGIQFYILLPSADMPSSSSDLATSTITVYDTPQDSEITFNTFPFKSQKSGSDSFPRLLAYRFRAYESVYNAYYRDIRNNPFIVDGRPVYNKWLPTMKGGADTTLYELHQCNWERDYRDWETYCMDI